MTKRGLTTLLLVVFHSIKIVKCERCSAGTYATYLGSFFSKAYLNHASIKRNQKIWLKCLNCKKEDTNINQCTHCGWGVVDGCKNSNGLNSWDLTIKCTNGIIQTADVRLETEDLDGYKLFEVFHNGEWGTVCFNGIGGEYIAETVCKQLQIPNEPCINCAIGTYSGTDATQCTACPRGTYAAITGTSNCSSCEAGLYSNTDGTVNCVQCSAGKYASTSGLSLCSFCPNGKYINITGASSCVSCAVGTYSLGSLSYCQPCEIGKYSNIINASLCLNCTSGFYSKELGATVCLRCSAGTYSSILQGSTNCKKCFVGKYSSENGATGCKNCTPGLYADYQESTTCSSCRAGTYSTMVTISLSAVKFECCAYYGQGTGPIWLDNIRCIGNEALLTDCTINAFGVHDCRHAEDVSVCCDGVFNQNHTKMRLVNGGDKCGRLEILYDSQWGTVCDDYFTLDAAKVVCREFSINTVPCTECSLGTYFTGNGATSCVNCSEGYYANRPGTATCEICEKGTFSFNKGATSIDTCTPCSPGSYSITYKCVQCPSGTFESMSGSSACQFCEAGSYSEVTGAPNKSVCIKCEVGSYSTSLGDNDMRKCFSCTAGKYNSVLGASSIDLCKACPPGSYGPESRTFTCTQCDEGKYSTNLSSTSCLSCDTGKYANASGSSTCTSCVGGSYNTYTGSSHCTVCGTGTFSTSVTSECKACISGKYSSKTSASTNYTCQSCPNGKYASQTSSSMCSNCTEGQYSNISDSTGCLTCLKGKYTKTPSLSACDFCVAGSFASSIKSSTCSSCARGSFSTTQGAETCTACERGKYSTHAPGATSSLSCVACGHGFFASELSSTICLTCEKGKYTSSAQTVLCRWCEPGKFSSMIGSTSFASCASCDRGYYNSAYSSSFCDLCPQGKYSSITRNQKYEQCMACPAGKQTTMGTVATSSSQCVECSIGKYSQEGGTCQSCPQGKYSEKSGTSISDCSACPIGTTTPSLSTINTKIQNCSLCAKGFNQTSIRRINSTHVACDSCPTGTYNPVEASSCSLCSAGSFSRENGATQCILCEKGTYASASAQSECNICPQNKPYSTFKGTTTSSSCKICPEGTFIDSTYIPQPSQDSMSIPLASYCDSFYETANDLSTPCFIFHESNVSNYPKSLFLKRQRGATRLGGDHYLAAIHLSTMNFDLFKLKISFTSNSTIDTSLQSTTLLEIWHVNGTCGYTSNNTLGIITVLSKENQSNSNPCQIKKTYGWDSNNAFLMNESISEIKSPILLVSWDRQDTFENVDKTEWTLNISIESRFPVLCQPCAIGKYADQPNSFSCSNCTSGTFAASTGNSICRSCGTGEFSTSIYHNCTHCEAGKYFLNVGNKGEPTLNDTCQQCDAGKFTSSQGHTVCTQCAQGSYSSETGRSYYCTAKCLATETAIASTSETQCTPCQPGTFTRPEFNTSTLNMSFFTSIFRFNDTASYNTAIIQNPQGRFSKVEPFNEVRLLCAYIGIPGAYKIELDLMQFFKSQVWSLSAWKCTQQANITNYYIDCTIIKTFESDQGRQTRFQFFESNLFLLWQNYVPDGWVYFDTDSDILPDWTITYNVTFSSYTTCVACPKGSFSTGTRESACTTCPRGKYSQINGAFSDFFCTECAEGHYNDYQAGECFVCEEGQYSTSAEFCGACPVGKYNSQSKKTTCSTCQPGLYNNQIHQSTCFSCDKGSYSTELSGPTYCTICATGKYNTVAGASTCYACPFIHSTTKVCIWCKMGEEFQSSTSSCKQCNIGKFNAENSITICTTCPRGYTNNSQMSSCIQCQPGYYENSSQCIPCTATNEGSMFSNETMTTSCLTCAKGFFARPLATVCNLCNIGTYFYNGACKECEKGTYTTKYGNAESKCVTCPRGFFSPTKTSCIACAQGYFSPTENSTSCSKCPIGKYSTFIGAMDQDRDCVNHKLNETCQACQKCPGLSTPKSGTECLKGSSTDTTECECPSNYYFDGKTCIMCSNCIQNTTTIQFCEKGTKNRDTTICKCPRDFYGDGVVSCTPCPKCPLGKTQITNTCSNLLTRKEQFQIKCI